MTKTIEQLAREAGGELVLPSERATFLVWQFEASDELDEAPAAIERFAALVRADERENLPVIETCDRGHRFGFLPDHPRDSGGLKRCPHCLAIGLAAERERTAELEKALSTYG